MTKQEFSEWCKSKRLDADLSHLQVKILTGRNSKDIERGKVNPGFKTFEQLGGIYNVPRAEWLEAWLNHIVGDDIDTKAAAVALAAAIESAD